MDEEELETTVWQFGKAARLSNVAQQQHVPIIVDVPAYHHTLCYKPQPNLLKFDQEDALCTQMPKNN